MKWVTRAHVQIDRVASAWLINNFVDKDAEFFFAPGNKPPSGMGTPFSYRDIGDLTHPCFANIIKKYNIKDPWVHELVEIVRGQYIYTPEEEKVREAPGVEAIARGAVYLGDDYDALENAYTVYDALYIYVQYVKIREKYKDELAKMERAKHFDFIKSHIKQPPKAKVKRPST